MLAGLATTHPHLFSETAVFLDRHPTRWPAITAIEGVIALPAYQQAALVARPRLPAEFRPRRRLHGVRLSPGSDGPRLIEINTNAGGALLNAALARAHRDCCEPCRD